MKKAIQRFDFVVSFIQFLLGNAGLVCVLKFKSQLDTLTYVLLILVCALYILEEFIDLKRIIQDQHLRDALYRFSKGHPTKKDIGFLTKKGIIHQNDGDNKDN